jgi:type II secretory pathway component PulK
MRVQCPNDHGYALIIVLGILATLSIIAMSLGAAVRTDLVQTRRFQDETAAEFLARGGIEWAMHYLHELERQDSMWQTAWLNQPTQFQNRRLGPGTFDLTYVDIHGTLHYGMQDEEARANLNTAPLALLAALPGLTAATAEAIVAQRRQQPWTAPEDVVQRGLVSASSFYGTAEQAGVGTYLTVWGSGKINVNTAALPVLAALPGMTPAMAGTLVRFRQGNDQLLGTSDDRPFRRLADALLVLGLDRTDVPRFDTLLTVTPTAFRVIATGRVRGGQGIDSVQQRLAIIDRTSKPAQIRYGQRAG